MIHHKTKLIVIYFAVFNIFVTQHTRLPAIAQAPATADPLLSLRSLKDLIIQEKEGKVTGLDFRAAGRPAIAYLKLAREISTLQFIALSGDQISPESLDNFDSLPSLKHFRLDSAQLLDATFRSLASLPKLEELQLDHCEFPDSAMSSLASIKTLKRLRITGCNLTDLAFRTLCELTQLELLDLNETSGFGPEGFSEIQKLSKLRALTLWGDAINDATLLNVQDLTSLVSIAVRNSAITNEGCKVLSHLSKIKELDLMGTKVDASVLAYIANPKNITKLKLRATAVKSMELATNILPFENLSMIDLGETTIDDTALASLALLGKLEDINLLRTNVSNEGIRLLVGMKLKKLNLDDIQGINDSCVDSIAKIHSLEFLHLGKTGVTSLGIAKLSELKHLKDLLLNGTSVSDQAVQALQNQMPHLQVRR